jgi:hypothetical protein
MIHYNYLKQLNPPAPFVYVTLRSPDGKVEVRDVPAQVDTAADRTALPAELIERLGLQQLDELLCGGFGGSLTVIPSFVAQIGIQPLPLKTIELLGAQGEDYVLLGRDILNDHIMQLNGPALSLGINDPPTPSNGP